jgi:phage FluMu gp28-like protein
MRPELQPALHLPPALALRPYQVRWVQDRSRFKIAIKSARIGFSFATALEAVLDCLAKPNDTWTVLSASKAQSVEFIETCHRLIELMLGTADLFVDEDWYDELGRIEAIQQRVTMPNGSRIIALPANPRTARGYPGNAILDEFAHHEDSYAIWAAITRQVALGHKVRVLSTPNGEQGKFYDLCLELGLTDGVAPAHNFERYKGWSIHWIDVTMAVADGCPIDMVEMRDLIKDEDIVAQEFYCRFLKATGAWLPIDLVQACEDPGATMEWPIGYRPRGALFGGIDVGRSGDRTSFWLKEKIGDVLWTRMVLHLHAMPFPDQARAVDPWVQMTTRTALDTTGLGIGLYDDLVELRPINLTRIMGVNFAGSSRLRESEKERRSQSVRGDAGPDGAVRMKVDLAIRIKRSMEGRKERIPYDLQIRQELQAVKREQTATGVTFDAPRIEVDSGTSDGKKKKVYAHADDFWAHALATYAASGGAIVLDVATTDLPTSYTQLGGYF